MGEEEARRFLIDLYEKGESGADIAAAASVMREHSVKLPISDALRAKAIDVVGTGGDRSGSFNISTTVSLLLASIGCVVAKHGNRSITSKSGSADVLEALGINLNLNPAGAQKYLLGVFDPSFIRRMAEALVELDAKRAYVVSAQDGMDEISLSANSSFAYVEAGKINEGEINPESYGFKKMPKEAVLGGDAQHNAQITRDIFAGKEQGAKRDIVLLNAAFAIFADGRVRDIQEAVEMAKEAIDSGKAEAHLEKISEVSRKI